MIFRNQARINRAAFASAAALSPEACARTNPQGTDMTQIDTDKLRALADALGKVPDDTPDAAYFGLDMTHGQARGNLAAILAMAEDNRRLREALEWIGARRSYPPERLSEFALQALAAPGDGG